MAGVGVSRQQPGLPVRQHVFDPHGDAWLQGVRVSHERPRLHCPLDVHVVLRSLSFRTGTRTSFQPRAGVLQPSAGGVWQTFWHLDCTLRQALDRSHRGRLGDCSRQFPASRALQVGKGDSERQACVHLCACWQPVIIAINVSRMNVRMRCLPECRVRVGNLRPTGHVRCNSHCDQCVCRIACQSYRTRLMP